MFSAAFPYNLMDGNDAIFIVKSQMVVKLASGDVDIGRGAHYGSGAADGEADEGPLDDQDKVVNNVVETYGLQEVAFGSKKEFMEWAKPYLLRVKGQLETAHPSRLQPFMTGAQRFLQLVGSSFDDWSFFANANMDMEGMIVFAKWEGENPAPDFHLFRDGLALCFPGTGRSLGAEACVSAEVAAREGLIV